MKKSIHLSKKLFILPFATASLIVTSCGGYQRVRIGFASYLTAERVEYPFYFNEDYFSEPASEYNEHLAASSACLALAGFSATNGSDYENSPNNAIDFFKVIGFEGYKSNEFGVKKPTTHSFGVYLANKKIDDYTLIAITNRGAGYLAEWASNVTLGGDGAFATGFKEASDIYLDTLKSYSAENNIRGKIKIWAAGYSRGGAGTNLAIGRIDDGLLENENIISDDVTFTKDDLYAYCFETPAGKIATFDGEKVVEKGDDYSNIHCVININDMVSLVGPSSWGFVRYGIDHYIPDLITDLNFNRYIKKVKNIYNNLPNSSILGEYQIDKFIFNQMFKTSVKHNRTMNRFLTAFINELSSKGIGSREEYSTNFEKALADIFAIIYKNGTPKDSLIDFAINVGKNVLLSDSNEVLLTDLQHNRKRFWQDFKPALTKALKRTTLDDADIQEIVDLFRYVVEAVVAIAASNEGLECLPSLINFNNFKSLASGHYPELLLSHISALDSNYMGRAETKVSESYFEFTVKPNSDFVFKNDGKVLARFEKGVLDTSLVAEESDDEIIFYMPEANLYEIESEELVEASLLRHSGDYLVPQDITEDGKDFVEGEIAWVN